MIKIKFKNGASGKTPLNATNLNKMQDNIEEATMINRISLQGNSVQEGTPSINSEAPIESVGDNVQLLQVKAPSTTKNGVTFTNNGDGTVTVNGTATANTTYPFTNEDGSSTKSKRLEKGTYTISSINSDYSKHFLQMATKDDELGEKYYNPSSSTTFDTVGLNYAVLIYVRSGITLNNVVFKPKLEKVSKATTWSPYGQGSIGITMGDGTTSETKALYTQQPFRAIGDVKDKFVKQNGVWYEEHNISRIILNGTESWITASIGTNYSRFYIKLNDKRDCGGAKVELKSNMFISRTFNDAYKQDIEGVSEYQGTDTNYYKNAYIKMLNTNISSTETTTITLFKAKLTELYNAGTPVYIDYVLAEPLLIPCTAEQVEVLSDICSAYVEGMTNIICNDEIEPVIEIVKETKETVQSENDKAISMLLARIEELEKKIQ